MFSTENIFSLFSQSVPFSPKITDLAANLGVSRNSLLNYLTILALDNLEYGFGNKIPLWLFGMLY